MLKNILIIFFSFNFFQNLSAITLEEYLSEVRSKNSGLLASQNAFFAKSKRAEEASFYFRPSLFMNGQYSDDQRPVNAPSFQGTQTLVSNYQLGLAQNFRTGTRAQVSYNYRHTEINGASVALLPRSAFYDMYPQIELTQSLWRNFFGAENRAFEQLQNSKLEVSKLADQFHFKEIMLKAESAYCRYYFAEKALQVQKESLESAKKLRDWNKNRVLKNLTDEADLLQAESNYQSREIEFENTLIEVNSARKNFNTVREVDDNGENLNLMPSEKHSLANLHIPAKSIREDLLISLANSKMADAEAALGAEKNRPTFEVYGQYAHYGRDILLAEGIDKSFSNEHPYKVVGVRFSTPLDFLTANDYKNAYLQEKNAAHIGHQRKIFEAEKEWEELSRRFDEFKRRLELTVKMEEIQKKKLNVEKIQYGRGRTTTFQVLQFEQDYANAQLLKLKNQLELLSVYNQLKLFSEIKYE